MTKVLPKTLIIQSIQDTFLQTSKHAAFILFLEQFQVIPSLFCLGVFIYIVNVVRR